MFSKLTGIKYGAIKAVIFIICFLLFSGIFHLFLVIFGKPLTAPLLNLVDGFGIWYYREFVTISLTNPFASTFWIWIFHKLINKQSFFSLGLKFSGYKKDLVYGLLIGFGCPALAMSILYALSPSTLEPIQFSINHHLLYVFIFSCVAISEEVSVRGFILQNLHYSMNIYMALGLSSLAFVIFRFHIGIWGFDLNMIMINPLISINMFLFGFLVGLYSYHRKNLWFAIGMNFGWAYFSGPICNSWSMRPLNTVFGNNLNQHELNGSFVLTVLFLLGVYIVNERFKKNLMYTRP